LFNSRHIFLLTLFWISLLNAQQYFSGVISQDTRWMGDIHINGDVTIPRGVILSIEKESRVYIKPKTDSQQSGLDKNRVEITVDGILLAKGVDGDNKIRFTSESENGQPNDWYGIVLKNLYEKSTLSYCTIEFAYKGITCYGSSPEISNCQVESNFFAGISCEIRSTAILKQCILKSNGFAGLICELASSPVVFNCHITQNLYGVLILSKSEPDLGHSYPTDLLSPGENKIYENLDYNIYNHSVKNIYAQNNNWNTNNANEIRTTIYDQLDNPSYGQVIFQPIYIIKRAGSSIPVPILNN
jgi:hypothetical protein